jgi:hypothetical protein
LDDALQQAESPEDIWATQQIKANGCQSSHPISPSLIYVFISNFSNIIHIRKTYTGLLVKSGHAVALLVEALRYKPEGRGFDSR